MAFHGPEAALDHVASNPNLKELAVRIDQRRNSPGGDNRKGGQHASHEPKTSGELSSGEKKFRAENGEKRQPGERPFGEEPEAERDVEKKAPIFPAGIALDHGSARGVE